MRQLSASDYVSFFSEAWGLEPFPWQVRLVNEVLESGWPAVIDLPTASGKTACIDVAVFTLALQADSPPAQRTAGRRIFFTVNRRIIVDEAHHRAHRLARRLLEARAGTVLGEVATRLRRVGGDEAAPPLDVASLRGGIPRDNRWARSATQPTVITSTIDQVGSRLLFRGYGVSSAARPLHAGLVANDSLLLLDEAHISQPFMETLDAVARYRQGPWAESPLSTPFAFIKMTATPGETTGKAFRLDERDRQHPVIRQRHACDKPVALREATRAKGKGDRARDELVKVLVDTAVDLVAPTRRNIAVVVNRVATARSVASRLEQLAASGSFEARAVHLAIGRMRPLDRDRLNITLQRSVGPEAEVREGAEPLFVVATQCLEVGADLDFDGMVSECASLDALRQRFGRLNRRGRDIAARGVVVVRADQTARHDDPIYGQALSSTWQWLNERAAGNATVDFGIAALGRSLDGVDVDHLFAPRTNAPVMFPAYLDMWAQTAPAPTPDPDPALFIHGPDRGEPEVQVCWRDDLPEGAEDDWLQIVSMCPPVTVECLPVPIGVARRWLEGQSPGDDLRSDMLGGTVADEQDERTGDARRAVAWRGLEDSVVIENPDQLRPGDTLVVPVCDGGWNEFGHVPTGSDIDVAEPAQRRVSGRTVLRLRTEHLADWPDDDDVAALREWIDDPDRELRTRDLRALLSAAAAAAPVEQEERIATFRRLAKRRLGLEYERYPSRRGVVLRTRRAERPDGILPPLDDGDDLPSSLGRREPVSLLSHADHLAAVLDTVLPLLAADEQAEALRAAARLHDWGKADERFQAMLANAPWAPSRLFAKSGNLSRSLAERRRARYMSGLPEGFRHEMLSVQLAEKAPDQLPRDAGARDLALHLVAAHHGRGRPFAPVVIDDDPPPVDLNPLGVAEMLTADERRFRPAHRLDSGVAERFWTLTRRFGWWGLAYLETVLRLTDQVASRREEYAGSDDASADTVEVDS